MISPARPSSGGGALSASRLANGDAASSIGAASSNMTDLVFSNGKLSYTGSSASTDRGATINNSANMDVTSGGPLTWNSVLTSGGSLLKIRPEPTHAYQRLVHGWNDCQQWHARALWPQRRRDITANNYSLGSSGSVTLRQHIEVVWWRPWRCGGRLRHVQSPDRCSSRCNSEPPDSGPLHRMSSSLSGGGTLNLEVNYVRGTMNNNWSASPPAQST